jgi:hypothetical protein
VYGAVLTAVMLGAAAAETVDGDEDIDSAAADADGADSPETAGADAEVDGSAGSTIATPIAPMMEVGDELAEALALAEADADGEGADEEEAVAVAVDAEDEVATDAEDEVAADAEDEIAEAEVDVVEGASAAPKLAGADEDAAAAELDGTDADDTDVEVDALDAVLLASSALMTDAQFALADDETADENEADAEDMKAEGVAAELMVAVDALTEDEAGAELVAAAEEDTAAPSSALMMSGTSGVNTSVTLRCCPAAAARRASGARAPMSGGGLLAVLSASNVGMLSPSCIVLATAEWSMPSSAPSSASAWAFAMSATVGASVEFEFELELAGVMESAVPSSMPAKNIGRIADVSLFHKNVCATASARQRSGQAGACTWLLCDAASSSPWHCSTPSTVWPSGCGSYVAHHATWSACAASNTSSCSCTGTSAASSTMLSGAASPARGGATTRNTWLWLCADASSVYPLLAFEAGASTSEASRTPGADAFATGLCRRGVSAPRSGGASLAPTMMSIAPGMRSCIESRRACDAGATASFGPTTGCGTMTVPMRGSTTYEPFPIASVPFAPVPACVSSAVRLNTGGAASGEPRYVPFGENMPAGTGGAVMFAVSG